MNPATRNLISNMLPYFYSPVLPDGSTLELDADTSHHVAQVLRMKAGEELKLTDGLGQLVHAKLLSVAKKACVVSVEHRTKHPQQGRMLQLAIAPVKNTSRFEWFIEKATELGVQRIIPIITQRTEKERLRIDRLRQVAIAAMLQSQQVWLPQIEDPVSLGSLIKEWQERSIQRLIAHCLESERTSIAHLKLSDSVGLMIGPEGDFTSDEIGMAISAGFQPVQLGNTRLRTETAGVVGVTCLRLP